MPQRPDLPFYAGQPVALGARQWVVVLLAVVAAFAVLVAPVPGFASPWGRFIPALLFCVLPLLALAGVAGRHWTALFARLRWVDVGWMVGFAVLNLAVTVAVGLWLSGFRSLSPNPLIGHLFQADGTERALLFLATVPQLLGEELLTVLPLLALLWLLHTRCGLSRRVALVGAWLLSALPFALAHLPTYQWDLLHCLAIIGSARLVLSLAYLVTRNLLVSTGAHILNDWVLLGVALWLGPRVAG